MIKPKRLEPGATIGLISPSSPTKEPMDLMRNREFLESLGYKVVLGRHVDEGFGNFYAASPEARAEDFNEMFARKDVDMVLCTRGGYSAYHFAKLIDYENVRNNPKLFCGFSDVTTLHLCLNKFADLVTIHGANLGTLHPGVSKYTLDHWLKALTSDEPREIKTNDPDKYLYTVAKGKAEGVVAGGNLCLVACSIGTPWQPDFKDKIVFLEEVGEDVASFDRYLSHIKNAGLFEGAKGIMFGESKDCNPGSGYSTSLSQVLDFQLGDLGIPCLYGLPMGHTADMAALPLGVKVSLDADAKTFKILEGGVL